MYIKRRRLLSVILAFVLLFSMLPMSSMAYAADDSTTYSVQFDSAGGSAVEEQEIAAGEKAKEPDAPTRDGYAFIGWFTEKDEAFDFISPINEDLTLTAKWTENALTADDAQNNETEIMDDQANNAEPAETEDEGVVGGDEQDTEEATCGNQPTDGNNVGVDAVEADNISETDDSDAIDGTVSEEAENDDVATSSEAPLESEVQAQTRALRTSAPVMLMSANVSGTIYASSLADNDDLVLTDNTTLVMDEEKTLKSISGDYALTIQGSNTLEVNNSDGHAISVKSLTSTAFLRLLSEKDALNVNGDINVSGGLFVGAGGDGVYSKTGNITISGKSTIFADKSAIYTPKGSISVTGDLTAETTDSSYFCVVANNGVTLTGGTISITSNINAVVAGGDIVLSGDITVSSPDGVAINARSGGNILIKNGSNIKATGGCGLYAAGGITMEGGTLEATGNSSNAIEAGNGDVILNGKITATAKESAIYTPKGSISVTGDLTAETTDSSYFCVVANNGVTLTGGTISITSNINAVVAGGDIVLSGDITASSSDGVAINARSGGNILIKNGSTIKATGGAGLYAAGGITMEGGTLEATGDSSTAIQAGNGDVILNGKITATAQENAVVAEHGAVSVTGDLTAETTDSTHFCVFGGNGVTLTGGTVSITSNANAVVAEGDITLNGDISIRSGYIAVNSRNGSDVIISGGTLNAQGNDYGIYSNGNVIVKGGPVIARAFSGAGIYAVDTITIQSPWMIVTPESGEISGHTIVDTSGNTATYVKIDRIYYSITFNPNGGNVSPISATTNTEGKLDSLPTPTRDGYNFTGWYSAASGGASISLDKVYTENTTIYAHWARKTYTITFDPNGGSVSPTSATTNVEGRLDSLPTPTREGYTFLNWCSELIGGYSIGTSKIYTADTTIYAHWVKKSYTVTFDSHSGSAVPSQTVEYGDKVTRPADPIRGGWIFDDWYVDEIYTAKFDFDTPITGPRTIYAKWIPDLRNFTVTFNVDGGSAVPSQTVIEGGKVTKPDDPTKEGFTFAGWYANSRKTKAFDFENTEIYENTTIYAKWVENGTQRYYVTFVYGSHTLASQRVYSGGYATRPASVIPPEHGLVFVDWYADSELTTLFDFENTPITGNTRVYSKWVAGYVVTFEPKNGDLIEINVEGGKTVEKPDDPIKEGFTFGGWYTDWEGTEAFDFSTPITEDIKLYAKWIDNTPTAYTVSFNANGGSGTMTPVTVNIGDKLTLPECGFTPPDGKEFERWDAGNPGEEVEIVSDCTITAIWKEKTAAYTVTFDANGHGTAPAAQTVNSGETANEPTAPTESGWTFGGWYTEAACTTKFDFGTAITGDITLYAKWTEESVTPPVPVTYTVTFETNGGSAVATQTVNSGEKATKPADPAKSGFVFDGWYQDATFAAAFDFDTPITADVTIYAKWKEEAPVPATYTVTFDANGHGTAPAVQTVNSGDTATKPANPTETGWTFGGWYTEAACTTAFDFSSVITGDITLYAKWTEESVAPPAPTTYTVTFDANGHGTAPAAQTVNSGDTAIEPTAPTESGWTFGGWYQDATCSVAFDFATAITADITLYAKWTKEATPEKIVYTVVSGGNSTWTKGSSSGVTIVVKRNLDDDTCFSHFTSVQIDGTTLAASDYDAKAGSTVITLKAATLQKLSTGSHTVTINFDDGSAATKLTIKAASSRTDPTSPQTGDDSHMSLWIVLMILSATGLCGTAYFGRKRRYVSKH